VRAGHFRLADDDIVLLCPNGLTDMVSDANIADALASRRTPQEQCDLLVAAALANGGTDNVTIVLANYHIRICGPTPNNQTQSGGSSERMAA
jgi:protein phosphatase